MQHPEDGHAARIDRVDAVNDQIGQARDHQFPCAGRPAQPAAQGELVKLLDGIQYPPTDAGSGGGVVFLDLCDNAEKIIMGRSGPCDRHGSGLTIRSKAATTVA